MNVARWAYKSAATAERHWWAVSVGPAGAPGAGNRGQNFSLVLTDEGAVGIGQLRGRLDNQPVGLKADTSAAKIRHKRFDVHAKTAPCPKISSFHISPET
jgi:hypothetical protein